MALFTYMHVYPILASIQVLELVSDPSWSLAFNYMGTDSPRALKIEYWESLRSDNLVLENSKGRANALFAPL